MPKSNTATQLEGIDLNSLDPKFLAAFLALKAENDALKARGLADPGTCWLNHPGPEFNISEAQRAKGFLAVTDMIMDRDYTKGDIMTVTMWKSPKAGENAIGRLTTAPKWTGEEPAETEDTTPTKAPF